MIKVTAYELQKDKSELFLVKEKDYKYNGDNKVNSPEGVYDFIVNTIKINNYAEEQIWVLGMNTRGTVKGLFKVGQGTSECSLANPAGIFARLLLAGCNNFIITHNHPSGDVVPSKADIQLTLNLENLGKMMGVKLLDHLVIGDGKFLSFKQEHYF